MSSPVQRATRDGGAGKGSSATVCLRVCSFGKPLSNRSLEPRMEIPQVAWHCRSTRFAKLRTNGRPTKSGCGRVASGQHGNAFGAEIAGSKWPNRTAAPGLAPRTDVPRVGQIIRLCQECTWERWIRQDAVVGSLCPPKSAEIPCTHPSCLCMKRDNAERRFGASCVRDEATPYGAP